jgi:hypothetical protein
VAAGTFAGAVLSYRAALSAATAYGQAMEAAFDLHRFDLLNALHLPLPADLISEVQANQQLSRFLRQPYEYMYALTHGGRGMNFAFDHHATTTEEPAPSGVPKELSRPSPPASLSGPTEARSDHSGRDLVCGRLDGGPEPSGEFAHRCGGPGDGHVDGRDDLAGA